MLSSFPVGKRGCRGLAKRALRGRVALANGLGVSILEHPGLMAYLPQLARQVLGEDLKTAVRGNLVVRNGSGSAARAGEP